MSCISTVRVFPITSSVDDARPTSPTPNHPDLQAIRAEMDGLFMAASTALDFMKLQIEIAGVVVYPDRQNEERESVAIVNDIVYREGEAIADDLFLMEISEDHIVFEYRGVPLTFDY